MAAMRRLSKLARLVLCPAPIALTAGSSLPVAAGAPLVSRACASSGSDEVERARSAAVGRPNDTDPPTIFDKILAKEIPAKVVHEDETCFAFRDVNPQGPVHVLVIPRHRDGLTQLSKAREDQEGLLGHLLLVAGRIGKAECPEGFRIVINDGVHGAQSVYHLHVHVIGGRQLTWPPG
mmetsp:Transcript_124109/g.241812  ORF Transcript_124109/g.241812 Transcript_124109/m.241812 type:complete len:178 (+) Transcript_124109:47-580(+)